jgi:hypothetical protein
VEGGVARLFWKFEFLVVIPEIEPPLSVAILEAGDVF